jgi:N-acetylglutamate synthase-like GNAT family acetyltransferase
MSNDPILRKLTTADISDALALSTEAGWNQTADDWRMLVELSPQGCITIEADGEVVSTATLTCYGTKLAWIGMVLTRIKYRGRGFAMRLLKECLRLADELGVESVKLDATNLGQPLYEKLGFRPEQSVERWWRAGREDAIAPSAPPPSSNEWQASNEWQSADRSAFGVDRSALLTKLAGRHAPSSINDSYLLTRAGREISYLGPSVCSSLPTARELIERALQSPSPGGWFWDLLLANKPAVSLAADFGFAPKRHLLRMVRGKDVRGNEAAVYALAGFELG